MKQETLPDRTTQEARQTLHAIVKNIRRVIVGKDTVIRNLILALATGRHVLVEDVPGVGKTTLIKSLARSLNLSFRRIQFTPDLLPSDITGTSVLDPDTSDFRFRPGPVFHNVVLADEINRASPKTQSSLLECMEESQVTVDGVTHSLPKPFLVMATQNPIEYEGTFPLPEAQLDRFALSLQIGYPSPEQEREMMIRIGGGSPLEELPAVAGPEDVARLRPAVDATHASNAVLDYIVAINRQTREHPDVYLGASPRASLVLLNLSKAYALHEGSEYVLPDHVKEMAGPVLRHRLILTPDARWENRTPEEIIREILRRVTAPSAAEL